jgi:predicted nicotinamide N-methyase
MRTQPTKKASSQRKTNNNSHDAFGITILKSGHRDIRRLKQDNIPSIHGNKTWGSSYLLMDYFQSHPIAAQSRVMELGCGWGLAGIYLAKQQKACVSAVDADKAVFPYLDVHADLNQVKIDHLHCRFEKLTKKRLSEVDVLIGADICFWDELSDTLFNLLKRAQQAGVRKIVIADPERQPFFNLAERCIDKFYAELEERSINKPRRTRGSLLIIENE